MDSRPPERMSLPVARSAFVGRVADTGRDPVPLMAAAVETL